MRLLVTRPEEDAARTAQALRARGHAVLIAPLLRIEAIEADLSGSWTAVLMTSANAARALSGHRQAAALLRLPAFTVGDRTAEAARAAGFTEGVSADGAAPARGGPRRRRLHRGDIRRRRGVRPRAAGRGALCRG